MKRKTIDYEEAPLCACGCGEKVGWHKHDKRWNTYLFHHFKKNVIEQPNEDPPLCACGCGNPVTWHKWEKRWNKVIHNHPINRGTTHTKEVKTKIAEKAKQRWKDPKYQEKMCESFKERSKDPKFGEKISRATKQRWKDPSHIGNSTEWKEKQGAKTKQNWENTEYREIVTQAIKDRWGDPEFKEKMANIMEDVRETEEYKANVSKGLKKSWKNQERMEKQIEHMKNCWEDPKYRRKQTERMQGENHHNWKGGISCEPYCKVWTFEEFKDMIRERDNFQCQNPDCWKKVLKKEKQTVHHIDYVKKNCHPLNLITVCRSCNGRANVNREYWQEFYTKVMVKKFKKDGLTKRRHKIIKKT